MAVRAIDLTALVAVNFFFFLFLGTKRNLTTESTEDHRVNSAVAKVMGLRPGSIHVDSRALVFLRVLCALRG